MSSQAEVSVRMGRPPIGPLVDFRVPEETDDLIRYVAERLGVPVDAVYREVLAAGMRVMRGGGGAWAARGGR